MIKYPAGAYGFLILFRLRGSAVFKSIMPALLSSAIYLFLFHTIDLHEDDSQILDHPYPMGALIAAFTFLLSFRANFAYNRYWEAFTAVHAMHSKWLDVGMDLAAFHLQAARYDGNKPPTFGAHPHLSSLERERERLHEPTMEEVEHQVDEHIEKREQELEDAMRTSSGGSKFSRWWTTHKIRLRRRRTTKPNSPQQQAAADRAIELQERQQPPASAQQQPQFTAMPAPQRIARHSSAPEPYSTGRGTATRRSSLESRIQNTKKNINAPAPPKKKKKKNKMGHRRVVSTAENPLAVEARENLDEKPLFLQEASHLLSLLSAVAMSTLRNDLENAESPLIPFTPGAPFPCVDPDGITADIRKGWIASEEEFWFPTLRYLFGLSRNEKSRSVYNAARPFRVIGGVSDNEVMLLQAARGPQAKVNLVSMWVQEFISREYLAGSTGKVAPPILSRLFQYVSDGCLNYNQARKVAYIPFPFPHAQITSVFVLVIVAFVPVLMLSFVTSELLGFLLNLLTVMCFAGLHEVSRELENPFQNAPNDLPANNLHAQYNEALMSMFAGYHPDAYWEVKEEDAAMEDESDHPLSQSAQGMQDPPTKDPLQPPPQTDSVDMTAILASLQGGNRLDDAQNPFTRGADLGDSVVFRNSSTEAFA